MRVLIPGASGFIGRNALLRLPREYEITALYNSSAGFPNFLSAQGLEHVRALQLDLTDRGQVEEQLGACPTWDAVLFLAANGNPSRSAESPAFDLTSNTLTVLNLLEICRTDRFIYFSSGAVYDGLVGMVGPDLPVAPRLPYGVSKLATEYYLRFFRECAGRVGRCAILRFFGAFGPFEPPRKVYTRLVEAFALRREHHFALRGDGTNLIDAMYIDDAVEAVLKVLHSPDPDGIFDLGLGTPLTIDELVRRAAACFGIGEVEVEHHGTTEEPIRFKMDPQPFARRFGFQATITLEEGLQRLAVDLSRKQSSLAATG